MRRVFLYGAGFVTLVMLMPVLMLAGQGPACQSSPNSPTFVSSPGATVITGKVSTFGPPGEAAGGTAFGKSSADPGIRLRIPGTFWGDARNRALMGHWFHVVINGHAADLQDIDLGPADWTGRVIDVTGAGAAQMGFLGPVFPTDAIGTATEIAAKGNSVPVSAPGSPGVACAAVPVSSKGYINPLPHVALWERTDMGVDAALAPGAPIVAPGTIKIIGIDPSWYAGQPYIVWQLLSGSDAGKYQFVSEQIANLATVGAVLQQGQTIATYAPAGTGIEFGWASAHPGRPSRLRRPATAKVRSPRRVDPSVRG